MHHASKEAQRQGNGDRKEAGQETAKFARKCGANIIDRATLDGTVLAFLTGHNGQCSLCIDRCHAEECDNPHPEDGTRTTSQNGSGSSDDVTGADLSSNGSSQCLEGCHAVFVLCAS